MTHFVPRGEFITLKEDDAYLAKYIACLESRTTSLQRQNEFDRQLIEKQQLHKYYIKGGTFTVMLHKLFSLHAKIVYFPHAVPNYQFLAALRYFFYQLSPSACRSVAL